MYKTRYRKKRTYAPKAPYRRRRRQTYRKKKPAPKKLPQVCDIRAYKTPLPRQLRNQMKYSDYRGISANNVAVQSHVWAINSMNDIDYTATGAQPPLYDTLYTLYTLARVNNVFVNYSIQNQTTRAMRTYFIISTSNATVENDPSAYDLTQHPGFLGYLETGRSDAAGMKKKKLNININKWFKKLRYPQPIPTNYALGQWATSGAAPDEVMYLKIYNQCLDESTVTSISYDYSIDFYIDVTWTSQVSGTVTGFDV